VFGSYKILQDKWVLSSTASLNFVKKGISIGFGISNEGTPEIWVNLKASKEEGLDWSTILLKIAKTIQ
jgi:hypothetical protein